MPFDATLDAAGMAIAATLLGTNRMVPAVPATVSALRVAARAAPFATIVAAMTLVSAAARFGLWVAAAFAVTAAAALGESGHGDRHRGGAGEKDELTHHTILR